MADQLSSLMSKTPFRLAICVRSGQATYRLAWLRESKDGIYIGLPATPKEYHASYHQDGTRHTRIGSGYADRYADVAVNAVQGVRKLEHFRLPLTKNWFPEKTLYSKTNTVDAVLCLTEDQLHGTDTLTIDLWLSDLSSSQQLQADIDSHFDVHPDYSPVARHTVPLQCFPRHQIALAFGVARTGGYKPDELLFAENEPPQRDAWA